MTTSGYKNLLIYADNLSAAAELSARGLCGKFDFIYLDPPFYSGADYKARVGGEKTAAYGDSWESMDDYISMLTERLTAMKELLSPTGLIAIHGDWHAIHYVKVAADKIFGYGNFVNELIWSYKSGGASGRSFARKHDTILLYAPGADYYFKPSKERSYNRGGKPYRFKNVEEFCDKEGRWYTMVNRKDVLTVDMVGRTSSERTGYATQKPLALMNILLESCCPEGGLVGEFFAGAGSMSYAAAKSGRSFAACDFGGLAIDMCRERFDSAGIEYELITL